MPMIERSGATCGAAGNGPAMWLAPLGVPMRLELQRVIDRAAVAAACGEWLDVAPASPEEALDLTLRSDASLSGSEPPLVQADGRQLSLTGRGVVGRSCADQRRAACALSPDWLAQPERLRAEVLEPLVLFLLTRHGRVPLHAAAIKAGDLAILLAGPSGAGKSTLALAADRAGWTVLSEDTTYLQLAPELAVWGWPGPVHLLPGDSPGGGRALRRRNGKLKAVVPLASRTAAKLRAKRAAVCLLSRGEAVALKRLSAPQCLGLMGPLEPGFDLLADEIAAARRVLASEGGWRLTLSSDPDEAIALLTKNIDRLRAASVGRARPLDVPRRGMEMLDAPQGFEP